MSVGAAARNRRGGVSAPAPCLRRGVVALLVAIAWVDAAAAQWGGASAPPVIAGGAGVPVVVAARSIPSRTVLSASDVTMAPAAPGAWLEDPRAAVGLEARTTLYAGRPIRAEDLSPPAMIERNEVVRLSYRRGGLSISAEGRALDRGAVGDLVRAMNLDSRQTITGRVAGPGLLEVAR